MVNVTAGSSICVFTNVFKYSFCIVILKMKLQWNLKGGWWRERKAWSEECSSLIVPDSALWVYLGHEPRLLVQEVRDTCFFLLDCLLPTPPPPHVNIIILVPQELLIQMWDLQSFQKSAVSCACDKSEL